MLNTLEELKRLRSQRTVAVAFGILFACMGMWLLVSIGHTSQQSQVDPVLLEMAKPLNPTLDLTVLAKIESKRFMSSAELSSFPIYIIVQDPATRAETVQVITPQTETVVQTGQ